MRRKGQLEKEGRIVEKNGWEAEKELKTKTASPDARRRERMEQSRLSCE